MDIYMYVMYSKTFRNRLVFCGFENGKCCGFDNVYTTYIFMNPHFFFSNVCDVWSKPYCLDGFPFFTINFIVAR